MIMLAPPSGVYALQLPPHHHPAPTVADTPMHPLYSASGTNVQHLDRNGPSILCKMTSKL